MKVSYIGTDEKLRSTLEYGIPEFPLLVLDSPKSINPHWHSQLEFGVVIQGSVHYRVGQRQFTLHANEGIFVNSNYLHMSNPCADSPEAAMFAVVFSPSLIAASGQSILYDKYILPIISNMAFQSLPLSPSASWQKNILENLKKIYQLDHTMPYGYELSIHNLICEIWRTMLMNGIPLSERVSKSDISKQNRLKTMMLYIQRHFAEPMTLQEIAASANISKSTCNRCFMDCMGIAPFDYLKEYRLEKAMQLLAHEDLSITEISVRCGFDSASYFIKLFKEKVGKTPLEYRRTR